MKNRSKLMMCDHCRIEFEVVTEPKQGDHEACKEEEMFLDDVAFCPACGGEAVEIE